MSSHTRPWSSKLPSLHPLTLGTQNLGCDYDTTSQSVAVVREAMDAGVSLHTSHNYNNGQSLNILKLAFREAPSSIPPLIGKIYCYNAAQIRLDVEEILERLPIDSLPVGQLAKNDHREREIVEDIINEGPMFDALCELKDKGLVGHWTFEIFQKFGSDAQKALEHDLFDSVTFYFNLLERETGNDNWEQIRNKGLPIIALRGLCGGLVEPANEFMAGQPGKPAGMVDRRKELQGLFDESGCASWAELSIRFLRSREQVRSIVIGTGRSERLRQNIRLVENAAPLDPALVERIESLQRTWAAGRTFDPNSPWV